MDLETIKTEIVQRFDLLEKERQTLLQRVNELSQEQLRLQGEARLEEGIGVLSLKGQTFVQFLS